MIDNIPQKKANPKAASKKVPEDENSEDAYEQATLSQQEAANEISKILES